MISRPHERRCRKPLYRHRPVASESIPMVALSLSFRASKFSSIKPGLKLRHTSSSDRQPPSSQHVARIPCFFRADRLRWCLSHYRPQRRHSRLTPYSIHYVSSTMIILYCWSNDPLAVPLWVLTGVVALPARFTTS